MPTPRPATSIAGERITRDRIGMDPAELVAGPDITDLVAAMRSPELAWKVDGACAAPDVDPDLFFPGRGESIEPARAICAGCPVRQECLDYALANGERFGVWGGTSERERRAMRSAARAERDAAS